MKLGRLFILLALFAFVGEIGNATIHTFGPLPDCQKYPKLPRCN
jgi:hypothetical protein